MQSTLFKMHAAPTNDDQEVSKSPARERSAEDVALNQICSLDCVEGMRRLADNSVDLAIADPPYNASKGGHWKWDNSVDLPGFGGDWAKVRADWDKMSLADYVAFSIAWVSELKRVVKPTGSLWIHGTYHNIGIINFVLQLLEIEMINEVIWYKRNSFPNLSARRITASHESILWAHTGGKRRQYYFDYETAKSLSCTTDSLKKAGKQLRTVWDIPNNKRREELAFGKHPTQKPLRLLSRMIKISSKPGQLCLVPFAGAGSECVAAMKSGLDFIGFEIDDDYLKIARERIKSLSRHQKEQTQLWSEQNAAPSKPSARFPLRETRKGVKSVPSLLKWTGSKRSQASSIADLIPPYRRYFEPFLGGGAVLFLAAYPDSVAGDAYELTRPRYLYHFLC